MSKYVDQSGFAAMLAAKRSAGVMALKSRTDITRGPKRGYQWSHKKD